MFFELINIDITSKIINFARILGAKVTTNL